MSWARTRARGALFRNLSVLLCGVLLACGALVGCSAPLTPEQELREWVTSAARAAEEKEVGLLRDSVSDAYADDRGNDRRVIDRLLTYHLLRHGSVHAFVRIESLELETPDAARLELLAALARVAIPDASALARLNADLWRIDLELRREDDSWRVVAATWHPATLGELL